MGVGVCAAGRVVGCVVSVHAPGCLGVRSAGHGRVAGDPGHGLSVAHHGLAGAVARPQGPMAGHFAYRGGQFSDPVCPVCLGCVVDQHRARRHPERHHAAVRRLAGLAVAGRAPWPHEGAGPGHRFHGGGSAGGGQGQLQTGGSGFAVLACLAATFCYGWAANLTRRFLSGVPALANATGSQLGSALVLAVPTALSWPAHSPSLQAWAAIAAIAVFCTGIAYILYFRLILHAGPARAMTVTFVTPLFAVAYGGLFLGEQITPWMVLCGVVIVCGTALSTGLIQIKK